MNPRVFKQAAIKIADERKEYMKSSGIKVWLHVETMSIVLSWHVFGLVGLDEETKFLCPPNLKVESYTYPILKVESYAYVGEAIENENNVVCVLHESYLKNFELIGEL